MKTHPPLLCRWARVDLRVNEDLNLSFLCLQAAYHVHDGLLPCTAGPFACY